MMDEFQKDLIRDALESGSGDSEHDALVAVAEWFGIEFMSPDYE